MGTDHSPGPHRDAETSGDTIPCRVQPGRTMKSLLKLLQQIQCSLMQLLQDPSSFMETNPYLIHSSKNFLIPCIKEKLSVTLLEHYLLSLSSPSYFGILITSKNQTKRKVPGDS